MYLARYGLFKRPGPTVSSIEESVKRMPKWARVIQLLLYASFFIFFTGLPVILVVVSFLDKVSWYFVIFLDIPLLIFFAIPTIATAKVTWVTLRSLVK